MVKYITCITCALILLSSSIKAQTWNRDYGVPLAFWHETPRAIEYINDSCYVVYVERKNEGGLMLSIANIAVDTGDLVWTKNYSDSLSSRYGGNYNSFDVAADGSGFALAQRFRSWVEDDGEDIAFNQGEFFLFDESFEVINSHLEGEWPDQTQYHQARFLNDGSIIAVGEERISGQEKNNILISKFTAQGDLSWTETFNTFPNTFNITTSISEDENGNLYVAGYRRTVSNEAEHVMLCKFDSSGQFIADLLLGDDEWVVPARSYLNPCSDGNFLYTTTNYFLGQYAYYYFSKYDTNLEPVWESWIDAEANSIDVFQLKEMSDHYIAVGSWIDPILGLQWGQIMKLSLDGELLWQRRYQHATEGFIVFNYLVDVIELDEGGYIAVGGRNDVETGENLWVIRLDEDGCLEEDCGADNVSEYDAKVLNTFNVFPNPASDKLLISKKDGVLDSVILDKSFKIVITDMTGRNIIYADWNDGEDSFTIDIHDLNTGNYLLKLQNESGQLFTTRIVKK
jgi:hypothetical protein